MVFSSNGTLHQWSSPRSSLSDLLQRYSSVTDQLPDLRHPEKEVLRACQPLLVSFVLKVGFTSPFAFPAPHSAGHVCSCWRCRQTWAPRPTTIATSVLLRITSVLSSARYTLCRLHVLELNNCRTDMPADGKACGLLQRAHGGSAMDTTTSDLLVTRARARTRGRYVSCAHHHQQIFPALTRT